MEQLQDQVIIIWAPADHQQCHLLGHVQELVQVNTSEGELPEGALLLDLCIRLKHTDIITGQHVASTVSFHITANILTPQISLIHPFSIYSAAVLVLAYRDNT